MVEAGERLADARADLVADLAPDLGAAYDAVARRPAAVVATYDPPWRREGLASALAAARRDVWCQIFADVMNVEIKQVAEPVYANARGAAWIGAVGLGEISFADVPKLVKIKQAYTPNNKNRSLYDERFDTFKTIYKQMKGVYKKLNG